MKILLLLIGASLSMNGCFWVAVGGAAGEGGYIAAQDDRTAGETVSDQLVFTKVKTALATASNIRSGNIEVIVRRGVVTLKGVLSSQDEKRRAIATAKGVDGVKRLVDKLYVD